MNTNQHEPANAKLKLTPAKMTQVVDFILAKRQEDLSDSEIGQLVETKFADYRLTFGDCAKMDLELGNHHYGGYWRAAYDWPQKDDTLSVEDTKSITVTDCGFFTFSM